MTCDIWSALSQLHEAQLFPRQAHHLSRTVVIHPTFHGALDKPAKLTLHKFSLLKDFLFRAFIWLLVSPALDRGIVTTGFLFRAFIWLLVGPATVYLVQLLVALDRRIVTKVVELPVQLVQLFPALDSEALVAFTFCINLLVGI